MINRILIRIKVVQILYSYLLVEKQFTLEDAPHTPTREKRFSYALYLDLLVLLIRVSRLVERRSGDYPLASTRFIERLMRDENLRQLVERSNREHFPFAGIEQNLAEKIAESAIYKRFLKDLGNGEPTAEENVWSELFRHLIMTDRDLNTLITRREAATLKGIERTKEMMERTFVNFLASQDNVAEAERALAQSLDKARELYFRLLLLPIELTELQDRRLDDNRHKFIKSEADINPDLRFVENRCVEAIRNNPEFESYIKSNKLSWRIEDPVLLEHLLKEVTSSEIYQQYMERPSTDAATDAELWRDVMRYVILENQEFLEALEEKSVFWNDDLYTISTFVLKTMKRIVTPGESADAVYSKFKDEEDARFGGELLRNLYKDKEQYREWIDEVVKGGRWDADRLAFMDVVIVETALAEILNFPKIPLQASVNEYIEIAKSYSTSGSGAFVHGVLGTILARLKKEGKLFK